MVTGESSDSNTNPLFQTGYNLGKRSSLGKGEPRLTKEVAGGAQTQNALGHSLPLTSVSKSQQSLTYTDNWCPDTSHCSLSHTPCAFWPLDPHSSYCFLTADTAGSKEKKQPGAIGK